MDNNEPIESGIKRRSLIKRAGIVGAGVAAWSAPTVTSLAGRAYAAGSAPTQCDCANNGSICGKGPNQVDNLCYCFHNYNDTQCFCVKNDFCTNLQDCSTTADCPGGTVCLDAVNGCGANKCASSCSDVGPVSKGGTGKTLA
jgi:hypothetical protein